MQILQKGKFFGISQKQFAINGITIVNSSFQNFSNCPWHYHKNAHFAFTTKGTLRETHKTKKMDLYPGCLMYNHSQEPHCNSHYSEDVSALHVDIGDDWFQQYNISNLRIQGIHILDHPSLKQVFFKLLKEVSAFDETSPVVIETLIIRALEMLQSSRQIKERNKPAWVNQLKELLHSRCSEKLTLAAIAAELHLHPVYLCQQFPVFFHCSFGDYIRKLKVEKAVQNMLEKKELSLTEIAYDCGFADQSHFIRTFKNAIGVTPRHFKSCLPGSR